ncbi:hypothetical protein SMACR_05422 [Sordaria macrospora]|uniref:WGS project CABT00000000 data, contig 2.6 n=2 Tax=Sordaria macrospora TaxID=5147 RepID=F7VSW5_SORMK|nr:uncharacterized protein SMAC_05422 [Sordaria macrospora k-hell]KAA8628436.1 hypothetical protein SMACR_05422 [Sordaria macrospora]WPJ57586.1 hypothetical protein SMAC4_05422 [Sordaria macrospora]CCC08782.1 unnamed protein product [Sordaria macrospora k-hell]
MAPSHRIFTLLFLFLGILVLPSAADQTKEKAYVLGTGTDGKTRQLAVDRRPALYTGDFGDCLGGESLFNVTKFDGAYFADNMTIVLHLDATSNIRNESTMNGENRLSMTFNPCNAMISSLCPLVANKPVGAYIMIPVAPRDVSGIPDIAYAIPDFEGTLKLRIFSNSSMTEIGCFQAVMRNGNSFAHPDAVASALGATTILAIIASFATAAYGVSVTHMRMHYAHSFSVFIILETFQAIFFSGALSLDWPSVLTAWWSNFAWSAGMIYTKKFVNSVDSFVGFQGNSSQVGGAGPAVLDTNGGLISQIYGKAAEKAAETLTKRHAYNASNPYDYNWAGDPVQLGLPIPGSWFGFSGTLSMVKIPAADAVLVGLTWIVIAIVLAGVAVVALKGFLELLALTKMMNADSLPYFRSHWIGFTVLALQRTFLVSFFAVMTLTMYQFTYGGSGDATVIAGVSFAVFLIGVTVLVALGIHSRTKSGRFECGTEELIFHRGKMLGCLPGLTPTWARTVKKNELEVQPVFTISLFRIRHVDDDLTRPTVHEDQAFVKSWGWMTARYRRTRWWFTAFYVPYLFVRAAFIGGGAQNVYAQIYGLLVLDIISFAIMVIINPFEGARNTAMGIWILSICKIFTTGLSIAFLPEFALNRIIVTAFGIIIIVIQGFTVVALLILVGLGIISTWMSLSRNKERFFDELEWARVRFFENMERRAPDMPQPKKSEKEQEPAGPVEPSFEVAQVWRMSKIVDEEADMAGFQDQSYKDIRISTSDEDASIGESEDTLPVLEEVPESPIDKNGSTTSLDIPAPPGAALHAPSSSHPGSRSVSAASTARYSTNSVPRNSRNSYRNSRASLHGHHLDARFTDRPDSYLSHSNNRLSSYSGGLNRSSSLRPVSSVPSRASTFSPATGLSTPSKDTLAKYAEQRRYSTPQPSAEIWTNKSNAASKRHSVHPC